MEPRLNNLSHETMEVPTLVREYIDKYLYPLAKNRDAIVGYSFLGFGSFWEYRNSNYQPIFCVQPLHPGTEIDVNDDIYRLSKNSLEQGEWWLASVRYKSPARTFYAVAMCSTGEKMQIDL